MKNQNELKQMVSQAFEIWIDIIGEKALPFKMRIQDIQITFSNSYKTLASYSYDRKELKFSRHFLMQANDRELMNVVLHEVLHILCPHSGHLKEWKKLSEYFNTTPYAKIYGEIKRLSTFDLKKDESIHRYKMICTECGFETLRKKKSKHFLPHGKTRFIHRECSGMFIWELKC